MVDVGDDGDIAQAFDGHAGMGTEGRQGSGRKPKIIAGSGSRVPFPLGFLSSGPPPCPLLSLPPSQAGAFVILPWPVH